MQPFIKVLTPVVLVLTFVVMLYQLYQAIEETREAHGV